MALLNSRTEPYNLSSNAFGWIYEDEAQLNFEFTKYLMMQEEKNGNVSYNQN